MLQSTAIVLWITGNVLTGRGAWDPYPFILLNLLLSFQTAYTAPAIMMSQNRQSELDRKHAETDYEINVKAELEIELLHEKIDAIKERELLTLSSSQSRQSPFPTHNAAQSGGRSCWLFRSWRPTRHPPSHRPRPPRPHCE